MLRFPGFIPRDLERKAMTATRLPKTLACVSVLALAGILPCAAAFAHGMGHMHPQIEPAPPGPVQAGGDYYYPANDEGVAALPAMKAAQLATAGQFTVFHGFQFTDRLPESGITFRNEA